MLKQLYSWICFFLILNRNHCFGFLIKKKFLFKIKANEWQGQTGVETVLHEYSQRLWSSARRELFKGSIYFYSHQPPEKGNILTAIRYLHPKWAKIKVSL